MSRRSLDRLDPRIATKRSVEHEAQPSIETRELLQSRGGADKACKRERGRALTRASVLVERGRQRQRRGRKERRVVDEAVEQCKPCVFHEGGSWQRSAQAHRRHVRLLPRTPSMSDPVP